MRQYHGLTTFMLGMCVMRGGARACDRSPLQLERMRATTDRAMLAAIESGPPAELRYSIGGSSASRQWLHDPAYCELLDLPTTSPILRAIFGSGDYLVGGAGGDAAMPVRAGALPYTQGVHLI